MKTAVKISSQNEQNEIIEIKFDVFEAVWGYLLNDNIALIADSRTNKLVLFSFASGKEQASCIISSKEMDRLAKCEYYKINYFLGNENSSIYKNEPIDTTGKFLEAIEAQFKGKNSTAIECYKAVIEANPKNFRAYNLLGRCLRTEGKIEEAIESYNKAIEIAPEFPEAFCNLGVLFQKEGLDEKAQDAFTKAIDVDNFYCNALVKRATWLLENEPDNNELMLYNLRISAVHGDITNAQNHIKAYMKKMGYDRIDYSDKETAYFGEFADYKIHKELRLIESYINNGAFVYALNKMKEVLESTSDSSIKNEIACWCHSRAKRASLRLEDKANHEVWKEFNKIYDETPSEEKLEILAEEAQRKKELEKAMKQDRENAQKREKEALAAMENKVYDDGDYSQPIGVPIQKEMTQKEKEEALAEQSLLENDNIQPPKPENKVENNNNKVNNSKQDTTKPNVIKKEEKITKIESKEPQKSQPAETVETKEEKASVDTDDLLTGNDDIPAPPPASDYDLLTAIEEMPAPPPVAKPIEEEINISSHNDIPVPSPVLTKKEPEEPVIKTESKTTSDKPQVSNPLLTSIYDEPAPPPASGSYDLLTGVDDIPAPPPRRKPLSEEDLLAGNDDIPLPTPKKAVSNENIVSNNKPAPAISNKAVSGNDLLAGMDNISDSTPETGSYDLLTGVDDMPAPPPRRKPLSEEDLLAGNDDIPAPRQVSTKQPAVNISEISKKEPNIKPKSTAELMAEADKTVDFSEPALKPMSTAELMAEANKTVLTSDNSKTLLKPMSTAELMAEANKAVQNSSNTEPLLKPKTTAELMAEAKDALLPPEPVFGPKRTNTPKESKPVLMPKSTAELMAEAKNVVLPPEPVLRRPDTKGIELSKDYKSPVKDVKPVTIQEFFMLVLFEVMRDGNIEKSEENFLKNLKNQLNIPDDDFKKMFNHVKKQVQTIGYKKEEGSFNPKRLFKNLCQAAWRDGILEESEKQLLMKVCKGFGIPGDEAKKIMIEAKNIADNQKQKEDKK